MNRLTNILMLVLAAQLLLSAALFWPREQAGESDARAALLDLTGTAIDRLEISDGEATLSIARRDGRWILPDYHQLPVERARFDRALIDLPALARGWPVAGSETAAERFEVAEDNFQRRVDFMAGEDPLGSVFLGTSPGFRKVHVRPAGDEAVYAVEFNTFELPTSADEWLDKSLLGLAEVNAVQGLDYSIRREGDDWTDGEGGAPDPEAIDGLINGLGSLRVSGVADIATAELLEDLDAPPTLIVNAGDARYEYRLYEIEDAYYLQRNDIPVYFSLGAFDYDRLNDVNAEALYAATAETETDPDAEPGTEPGLEGDGQG